MDRADRVFSYYIRQRDANEYGYLKCVSCNQTFQWQDVDCGHFNRRGIWPTRYDEQNCAGQCKPDNRSQCGKQQRVFIYCNRTRHMQPKDIKRRFADTLMLRHGPTIIQDLDERARGYQRTSIEWFQEMQALYLEKIREKGWVEP